ncbi:MAG: flagellar protein FlaG [Pseudomonadales bacterium]
MSVNEVTGNRPMPAETRQAVPTAPVAQTPAAPTKVEAAVKAPQISAEEMGVEAASRKDATTSQLNDMNERLQAAIETLNAAVKKVPTALSFSHDESSNRFVVQVTDTDTGEIIRSLPGDAVLRMSRQLDSLKGVLFDDVF